MLLIVVAVKEAFVQVLLLTASVMLIAVCVRIVAVISMTLALQVG